MRHLWAAMAVAAFLVCAGCKELDQLCETSAQTKAREAREHKAEMDALAEDQRKNPQSWHFGKKISAAESEKQMQEYLQSRGEHYRTRNAILSRYRG